MEIESSNFGRIDIEEDKIIEFEKPILGFDKYSRFTIIDSLDDDLFYWLQSIKEPNLSFAMINPADFVEDYQVSLNDKFSRNLGLNEVEDGDVIIYTLISVGENGSYVSTNLKAPIIINAQSRKAGQLILNEDYPTRYYLVKDDKTVEVSG